MIGPVPACEVSVTDLCESCSDYAESEGRDRFEVTITATYAELVRVEEGYLRAAGWTVDEERKAAGFAYMIPPTGAARFYGHGHAVNAQKFFDRSVRKSV